MIPCLTSVLWLRSSLLTPSIGLLRVLRRDVLRHVNRDFKSTTGFGRPLS